MTIIKTFVALPCPQSTRTQLRVLAADAKLLDSNCSPVHSDNYHMTLAYIGATTEEQVRIIKALLPRSFEGLHSTWQINRIGYFRKPKILYGGGDYSEVIENLAQSVRLQLKQAGIAYTDDGFTPHITIARKACPIELEFKPFNFEILVPRLFESMKDELGHRVYRPI